MAAHPHAERYHAHSNQGRGAGRKACDQCAKAVVCLGHFGKLFGLFAFGGSAAFILGRSTALAVRIRQGGDAGICCISIGIERRQRIIGTIRIA